MTSLTLTTAGRLQERLRAALRELPLGTHLVLNIFAQEPEAVVEREATRLRNDLDVLECLLSILASLRAAVGKANAQCGIGDLLAEKAAIEEEMKLLEDFAGFGLEDRYSLVRHAGELEQQARALRARYEQAEEGETQIRAPLLDEADLERLNARRLARRRRLEEIGDRLRELNGNTLVEIDSGALAYLREKGVI
jgi:hypothetical protein